MKDASRYILDRISQAVEKLDEEVTSEFIEGILQADTVFIYGVGRSGLVGQSFAVRLVQMGLDVHFVGDMTTPIVRKSDLTMIISNTGETMSAVQTANISRRLGSKVVSITSDRHSKLALASNLVVELKMCHGEKREQYAPLGTLFEDTAQILLDSLIPTIMAKMDETESNMSKRHAIWV